MRNRRRFPLALLGLALLLLALLLGACGGLPSQIGELLPALGRPQAEGPTTALTLWAWPENAAADGWLQSQVDIFVEANPAVTVTVVLRTDYPDALDDLLAGDLPVEETPDLLLLDLYRLPQLVEAGLVGPLPAEQLFADDLQPLLRSGASVDGQLYCLPFEFNTLALLYNRDLFDAAGIAYPAPDWTWAELAQAATAISDLPTDRFTAYGLVLPADVTRWLPFLYQTGGTLLDATGAPALDPIVATQAISTYVELVTEGPAVEPVYLETGWGGEALGIGRVGMAIEGNWTIPYLAAEHPSIPWGVAPLPAGPAGTATLAFGTCWAVAAGAGAGQEAAVALLGQLSSPGAQLDRMGTTAAMPARPSLADAWRNRYPELAPFLDGLASARLWQLPVELANLPRFVNRELRAVLDGDLTAAEAQAEIRARMEAMLAATD
jgi:multiple sugar transport system substrate-binding protein